MKKIDKFGLQLAAAFTFGLGVIALGWALSANAEPLLTCLPNHLHT